MSTRVLKAHIEAVLDVLDESKAVLIATNGDHRAFAQVIAQAVLSATDKKTTYVILVKENDNYLIYGPYASVKAAKNVLLKGYVGTYPKATGMIVPLIPSPKGKVINNG